MSKIERNLEQTRTAAYHESGHAIAALILNQHFCGVTIKNRNNSWGRLEGYTHDQGSAVARAVVYLSGPITQSKMRNQEMLMCSGDYFFNCGGTGDLEVVCQNINWLYYIISNTKYKNFSKTYMPCKRKFYQGFLDTTRQLVDENHDQIELLANKLLKKETLWYADIIKLLVKNEMFDSLVIPKMPKFERI